MLAGHSERLAQPPNARDKPLPHAHTHGEQGMTAQGVFCTKANPHNCKLFVTSRGWPGRFFLHPFHR